MSGDVVELTERLVAVDTAPGRSTSPLVALLADELARLGARVTVQDGEHEGTAQRNVVARLGGDGPAGLVLAGHLDTVPWRSEQRANTRPERDGSTLYGRGTADMKGPVAAQLRAAERVTQCLRRPLVLAWTHTEEVGCHGASQLVSDRTLLGDLNGACCLVGEPTGLVPITSHKGYGMARVRLHGVPAHSSDPWAGADVTVALGAALAGLHELRDALQREAPDSGHAPPGTTLNTGLVSAGTAPNVVPDRADFTLEFRPIPGTDEAALRARVQAILDAACARAPGVTVSVEWLPTMPPFAQDTAGRVVAWITGRTGHAPGAVSFYTEAELYRVGLSVPTVVCGPGSIEQAHRVDECITFEQLEQGVDFYEAAILEFCG